VVGVYEWLFSVHRFAEPQLRGLRGSIDTLTAALAERAITRPKVHHLGDRLLSDQLAVWQAGGGRAWLDKLVETGAGMQLRGGGYPDWYLLRARDVVPPVLSGPPEANEVWRRAPYDIVTPAYKGKTWIDREALTVCEPEEWLVVEVWDES
jgi:hypothetical protein